MVETANRIVVLHLIESAAPEVSSFQRIVQAVAHHADKTRFEIHVWILGENGPVVEDLRSAGAEVRVIPWTRSLRNDPLGALRFWRALRRERIDIVHQHFGGGRAVRFIIRCASSARILVQYHGVVFLNADRKSRPVFSDRTVANSKAVARCVQDDPGVIYPGVEHVEIPTGNAPHEKSGPIRLFGMAGRIVEVKGFEFMIRAFGKLLERHPELRLEIAGDGADRFRLERLVTSAGLDGSIRFLGWQSDLCSRMLHWDVFVQPSVEEGFGMAALDAMSVGLPVIASRVRGLPELVQDHVTGLLAEPGDVEGLVRAAEMLIGDPGLARSCGRAGRARAQQQFNAVKMVKEFESVYLNMLGRDAIEHCN